MVDSKPLYRWMRRFDSRLAVILLVAIVMRLPYLGIIGHNDIIRYNVSWIEAIQNYGIFRIYLENSSFNYPPLYLPMLGLVGQVWSPPDITPIYIVLHKLYPVAAELLLIAAVYSWLPRMRCTARWIIPLLLAVHPGLIVTSAFWGQIDAIWTFFLVLSLIALNCDRPTSAWLWFTLGVLTKFPALIILPLLLVLTVRRYGYRRTAESFAMMVIIVTLLLTPFIVSSGLENALRPFTSAVDVEPATTGYAFNLWYILIPSVWFVRPPLVYELIPNAHLLIAPFTYKHVGIFLFGVYGLLILLAAWRNSHKRREFVWGAALYFGFFMLPTQVHERYLYPAAIFLIIGVVQDRRLWLPALGTLFTYSYNVIVPTHAPFVWLGINVLFVFGDITLHIALLNLIILAWATWIAVSQPDNDEVTVCTLTGGRIARVYAHLMVERRSGLGRVIWGVSCVVAGILVVAIVAHVALRDSLPNDTVPLDVHVGDNFVLDGRDIEQTEEGWMVSLYWRAVTFSNIEYKVFVHAVDGGETIAQCDSFPQDGAYPTWRWYYNRLIQTMCELHLPDGVLPDHIYAGLYDSQTMHNLPVVQNGETIPDGRVVVFWEDG